MRRIAIPVMLFLAAAAPAAADPVAVTIHADKVANKISPLIYGHFFEHIYNGGDNGLWGEMVWNRSFEYTDDSTGKWAIDAKTGIISQTAMTDGAKLTFGGAAWKDYEFSFDARKTGGNEGFLGLVRVNNPDGPGPVQFFWANIAGWGDTVSRLQHLGAPRAADLGERALPTKVETGKWYHVRVRCEGSHVQAWLDEAVVIDAQVPEDLDHGGAVGLGTWETTAEFKNCRVTDLGGKVLFEGVPKIPEQHNAAGIHWETSGDGKVSIVHDAFNDENAVHIDATAGVTVISQPHFALAKGGKYHGSLYLKGNAPSGMVGLINGDLAVVAVSLPAASAGWTRMPIDFTAPVDAPDATLAISFPKGSDVRIDQVSLMSEATIKNDGFRPDIYEAFAVLKPTIIRWPGGCYAEQYHWKNGIGPHEKRTKSIAPMWDDYDPNALGTDEYLTLCRKLKCEPLLVVNTGMHVTGTKNAAEWGPWIQEACDWVEYVNGPADLTWGEVRAANGHAEPYHVKYFEIDNELWRSLQPNPAVYAQAVPLFAAAMKKVDPTITIIAHGGNALDRRYDTTLVNRAAGSFDVLSIHHYTDPPQFASGVADQDKLYSDLEKLIAASANPKIKLDVSEWNLQTTDWRTGLYAGGLLNVFEKHGEQLEIGGPALLFRYTGARDWDNAFINFDQRSWFPGPNYVVMKLWRDHFAPIRLEAEVPDANLNLVATESADGVKVYLKAVNPTNAAMDVSATLEGGFAAAHATFEVIAPGHLQAKNSMEKPDNITPHDGAVTLSDKAAHFTLPAYSAGVVTLTK